MSNLTKFIKQTPVMLGLCIGGVLAAVVLLVAVGPIDNSPTNKVSHPSTVKTHAAPLAINNDASQPFGQSGSNSSGQTTGYNVQGSAQPAVSAVASEPTTLPMPLAPTGDYTPSDNLPYPIKKSVCKFYIDSFSDPDVCPACIDGSSAVSACGCGGSKFEMVCMAP